MQDWPSKPPHIDPTTSTRPPAPAAHCHRRGQTQRCRRRAAWGPWRGSNRQRLHRWGKANQIVSARLLASSKKCAAFTPLRLAGAFVTHLPGRLKCFFATAVMILPYDARSEALTRRSASGGGQRGKSKERLSEMQYATPSSGVKVCSVYCPSTPPMRAPALTGAVALVQPQADELGGVGVVALWGGIQQALEHLLQLAHCRH